LASALMTVAARTLKHLHGVYRSQPFGHAFVEKWFPPDMLDSAASLFAELPSLYSSWDAGSLLWAGAARRAAR
jgi:hypothetical protein